MKDEWSLEFYHSAVSVAEVAAAVAVECLVNVKELGSMMVCWKVLSRNCIEGLRENQKTMRNLSPVASQFIVPLRDLGKIYL